MNKGSKILIVGHNDIIESSLRLYFNGHNYTHVFSSSSIGLNSTIQASVYEYFQKHRPEYVFLASTRSGGIEANRKNPAEFIYHNLESQNNIFYSSWKFGVKKLLYFAGSCVYPKECFQPMNENALLTGPLEETSEPYSIAKIAGIKSCQAFKKQYGLNAIVMVPATVYGSGCDINIETSHVIGALIGKFADAVKRNQKDVTVWGTGQPRREFLYVDEFVEACLFLMENYDECDIVNVGCGSDVTIKQLAEMIAEVTGFKGNVIFDQTKPDGTMRKLLNIDRMTGLGWKSRVSLQEGIKRTYQWHQNRI